jgi:hypothetical protein
MAKTSLSHYTRYEPARARDWFLTVLLPPVLALLGLVYEVVNDWDPVTGWFGLAAGILSALAVRGTTPVVREQSVPYEADALVRAYRQLTGNEMPRTP